MMARIATVEGHEFVDVLTKLVLQFHASKNIDSVDCAA